MCRTPIAFLVVRASYSFAIDVPRMWFMDGCDKYIVALGLWRYASDRERCMTHSGLTILLGL